MASLCVVRYTKTRMLGPGVRLHILLVDDNPADARLMQEALKEVSTPVRLTVATGRKEAVEIIEAGGDERPDLVLLDLNLGRDSGWDVLERVKKDPNLRATPIVVMTSSRNPRDIDRAYEMFANCCMEKPAELDPFIETVRALLLFWSSIARLPKTRDAFQAGWPD